MPGRRCRTRPVRRRGGRATLGGVQVAHPVVGVGSRARRARGARAARRGASGGGDTARTVRSPLVVVLGAAPRSSVPVLATPGRRRRATTRRSPSPSALINEVDSFNPFNGHRGAVVRDVGPDVRLHGRLLDGRHVARCRSWRGVGDLRRRADLDLPHPRRRRRGPTASRSPPTTSPTPTTGSWTAAS